MSNKVLISIEGNIGAGKSTFIKILKDKWDNCDIVDEPVEMWKELVGSDNKNILQTFYEDMTRWAYSFQNIAFITRMMKISKAINNSSKKYIFLDRSIGTDKYIFEKMLHDDGIINDLEHQMYNLQCDFYDNHINENNDMIYIYLKCDPEISFERIKKRGRKEEESIDLEYLKKISKYHDEWLLHNKNTIVINCNNEFELNNENQELMINMIKSMIFTFINYDKLNEKINKELLTKILLKKYYYNQLRIF
jgi:deoxyadenosine/deoxycytidine kinase